MSVQLDNVEPGNNTHFQRPRENALLGVTGGSQNRDRLPRQEQALAMSCIQVSTGGKFAACGTTSVVALPHMLMYVVIPEPGIGLAQTGREGESRDTHMLYNFN